MDGPTLAFFGIGLAIVAVFVILMLWDDYCNATEDTVTLWFQNNTISLSCRPDPS